MRIVLMATLVLAITTGMRADLALSHGLCAASETSFFTCQTSNKQWIGLCGVVPGKLQYRFGAQGRVEFRYPENAADGASLMQFAHYSRFQTDRIEVAFRNQGVEYAVFDYTEARIHQAGVRVTTADGKEQTFFCVGKATSRLVELKQILQCDTGNALNGGNCP